MPRVVAGYKSGEEVGLKMWGGERSTVMGQNSSLSGVAMSYPFPEAEISFLPGAKFRIKHVG